LKLLNLLKDNNLSVSYPLPDRHKNFIQSINAPEGLRYLVVFSFAEGQKMRFMSNDTCFAIGVLMAQFHTLTENLSIDRVHYDPNILLNESYDLLVQYFSQQLPEMKYLKQMGMEITKTFNDNLSSFRQGVVHLDLWYDNMSVNEENEITIFDFDCCGNGPLILDVAYFCKQLFFIETDKEIYESKVESFLDGYQSVKRISKSELNVIPEAGASIFAF